MKFFKYVIRSRRAVLYPVYKGTYERTAPGPGPDTTVGRETLIQDSKDLGRSLDYLETRPDINRTASPTSRKRGGGIRRVIFTDGGFVGDKALPGTDQADFALHVKAPALNGCRQVRLDLSRERRVA